MTTTGATVKTEGYQGTNKLLLGIVLTVLTFWLFAGTAGTVAPVIINDIGRQHIDVASTNLAVSITALFSGLFIILMGGLADRVGRVKITLLGVGLRAVGSLLLVFAAARSRQRAREEPGFSLSLGSHLLPLVDGGSRVSRAFRSRNGGDGEPKPVAVLEGGHAARWGSKTSVTSSRRLRTPTFSKIDFRWSWTV